MSYILDALRKAERERGAKQVPTLMTEHAPRTANRSRLFIFLSLLLVCAATAAWFFIHLQNAIITSPAPGAGAEQKKDTTQNESGPNAASNNEGSAPKSASSLPPQATQKHELSSEMRAGAGAQRDVPGNKPAESIHRESRPAEEEDSIPEDEEEAPPVPPAEIMRTLPRPNKGLAGSEAAPAKPATLQEAIGKMTLSLLLFADSKAERIVFINGKKYVEGDYVEGNYLLESITLEGAILSYQGERALLRPKSK